MNKGKGDCIQVACKNVIANKEWFFCHAKVSGQGDLIGQRILHAWCEFGDLVVDFSNGNKVIVRKEIYYNLAKIKEEDVIKQTHGEIIKLMLKTKTYGGWIND